MSAHSNHGISRRSFVQQTGALASGALLGAASGVIAGEASASGGIPQRVLGRTGASVTTLTLGTAPCGFAKPADPKNVARCVNTAIDLGFNSIDTAPGYDVAETGVGMGLGKRRTDVFLATKVHADSVDKAEKILANSLKVLKTDYLDLVYLHNVGELNVDIALEPEGVVTWLAKQKKEGKIRFVGISGHNRPMKFVKLLESDEVDVLLTVVNFIDRNTYNFDEKVLPVARKHNVGIVAMKVFGGALASKYENPKCPPQLDVKHLEWSVRHSLSVPGVATLNIGVHNAGQIKHNVELVKNYKPLGDEEQQQVAALGKELAAQWKDHFGPIAGMPHYVGNHC
jgi:predicted aldo/keto reductase-like oxidoreductase